MHMNIFLSSQTPRQLPITPRRRRSAPKAKGTCAGLLRLIAVVGLVTSLVASLALCVGVLSKQQRRDQLFDGERVCAIFLHIFIQRCVRAHVQKYTHARIQTCAHTLTGQPMAAVGGLVQDLQWLDCRDLGPMLKQFPALSPKAGGSSTTNIHSDVLTRTTATVRPLLSFLLTVRQGTLH